MGLKAFFASGIKVILSNPKVLQAILSSLLSTEPDLPMCAKVWHTGEYRRLWAFRSLCVESLELELH